MSQGEAFLFPRYQVQHGNEGNDNNQGVNHG